MKREETIRIEKLSIGYQGRHSVKTVAEGITDSIHSGELTCLLGENGAGKSTLLRTLSGFLPPISGEITILGKPISVKNYICSPDGVNYRLKTDPVRLQLTLLPLSFCPASCPFCLATDTGKQFRIDTAKLEKTMKLLKAEDRVRGIKITGGEPFYDIELLNEVISAIYDIFGYQMEVAISTNGTGLENLKKLKK